MTIYKITRRYYFSHNECFDHIEEYVLTLDLARKYVKTILGEGAECDEDDDNFVESWAAPAFPHIQYLIDDVYVKEDIRVKEKGA